MANEFPDLQDQNPVFNPQKIESRGEGYDEFARTLGSFAEKSEDEAIRMNNEKSNSMYINSVANAEQVKKDAQGQMLEHPDQASKISQNAQASLDVIKDNSVVNSGDRARLNSYIKGTSGDVGLEAIRSNVQQGKLAAANTYYMNSKAQMDAINLEMARDPEKGEKLKQAYLDQSRSLVMMGAITPHEASASYDLLNDTYDLIQAKHDQASNPNTTSGDFHALNSNPLNPNPNDTSLPIKEDTQWQYDYYNNDKTLAGALSSVQNRQLPIRAFSYLGPADRQHVLQAVRGTMQADGLINSGESFDAIQADYDGMTGKYQTLSYQDQAKRAALGQYINELKNGDYLKVMTRTPSGNRVMEGFVQQNAAIQSMPNMSDEQKNQMMMDNKDDLINKSIAWGQAHHVPSQYINPIPKSESAAVQGAFQKGNDPSTVLTTLNQYSKLNQAYLANSMKDPDQRMIVMGIGLTGQSIPDQDKIDFITANQTGKEGDVEGTRGRSNLNKDIEGAPSDKVLMTRIYSNLKSQIQFVSHNYDQSQAVTLQNSMLSTTLRAAKYIAEQQGDLGMTKGYAKYVDQASKFYQNAYAQQSGTNWVVNKNQLSTPLTDHQLDNLAEYAIRNGTNYVRTGIGERRYNAMLNRGSLKMILTPTNDVQAVNANGDVAFSTPLTNNLLSHVNFENIKAREQDKVESQKASLQAFRKTNEQLLNVGQQYADAQ